MTEYDEVVLPGGQRHPLAGIPQGVLDAARVALREMSKPWLGNDQGESADDDRVLDGDVDSIADSMVNVIRATGWFAQGESELAAQLIEARTALRRLADSEPVARPLSSASAHGHLLHELESRRAYAHRAWLGDRVDRFKIPTPNEEER